MLLSHGEIEDLLEQNVVEYSDPDLINAASLDIRLGKEILIEVQNFKPIALKDRTPLDTIRWDLKKQGPYTLIPGEFILAHSHELFNLPNDISAEYMLKSSMARIGLDHLKAGWCDAGWNGSVLTLELRNVSRFHAIELHYLDKIGQMKFYRHRPVKAEHSYATKGRYNGDTSVSGAKTHPSDRTSLIFGEDNDPENLS